MNQRCLSEKTIDEFYLIQRLGKGIQGTAYLTSLNGQKIVIKLLKSRKIFNLETRILSALGHENIIGLIDSKWGETTVQEERAAGPPGYLLLEYAENRSLSYHLNMKRYFPPRIARTILHQIFEGLTAIHEKGFQHNDLHLKNIMFDQHYKVKIIDFGKATEESSQSLSRFSSFRSSINSKNSIDSESTDIDTCDLYMCGILALNILTGGYSFEDITYDDKTIRLFYENPTEFWETSCRAPGAEHVCDLFKDFATKLMAFHQKDRISIAQAMSHEWMMGERADRTEIIQFFSNGIDTTLNKEIDEDV